MWTNDQFHSMQYKQNKNDLTGQPKGNKSKLFNKC